MQRSNLNLALGLYASRNRQADFYVCESKSLSVQELLHTEVIAAYLAIPSNSEYRDSDCGKVSRIRIILRDFNFYCSFAFRT